MLYPSHISPFPLSWKHNYDRNKFTGSPCKRQFLTKINTAVPVTVSGEDHCQQISCPSCPLLTAVCASAALHSYDFFIGLCGAAEGNHIHNLGNEWGFSLKAILSRKDLSLSWSGVSVHCMSHVLMPLMHTESFAGLFGLLYYFFQSLTRNCCG